MLSDIMEAIIRVTGSDDTTDSLKRNSVVFTLNLLAASQTPKVYYDVKILTIYPTKYCHSPCLSPLSAWLQIGQKTIRC